MKINYLFAAIIVAALAFSCQTSDGTLTGEPSVQDELSSKSTNDAALNKDETGEPVLVFTSEDEMCAQIHNLKEMAINEGTDGWYDQFQGFTPQSRYMWSVVEELNQASSIEEVYEIQKSHAGFLVFNDNKADEDISPYIPTTYLGTDLVCNKYGNVMIAGKIMNFNDVQSYSELEAAKNHGITRAFGMTYIHGTGRIEYDERRFWVEAWYNKQTGWIDLKLTAHAHNWLGWNKYRTEYSLRLDNLNGYIATSSTYDSMNNATPGYWNTNELPAETFLPFVRGSYSAYPFVNFTVTAYSRGVPIPTSFSIAAGGNYN